ncbi:MAG: type VI secretion system Vgr family protein, partial [Desulfovibrionaceae bacterium]
YRAELVPKLWRLTKTRHNQIFLDESIKDFLPKVLKDGGLSESDFELKLAGSYPAREYVCQYNRSHFEFASYWMERDGLYYYFDHESGGKMVVTDSKSAHKPLSMAKTLYYAPASGLTSDKQEASLSSFALHQQFQPKKVLVRDYNHETPTTEIRGEAEACSKGFGRVYVFAENARKSSEAGHLAKVRAESHACREQVFEGEGAGPVLSGCTFSLKDHFRPGFNQSYLVTQVQRSGAQEAFVTSGLDVPMGKRGDRLFYRNTFKAIPDSVQFRAGRTTPRASFHGTMNARIWTEGSDQYAQVDKDGRYKVQLPFDLSGRGPGKATHWIRMAQPYVGVDHGMHFPLHKGTEVLLTFIDGDPDRPVIEAAAPNPEHKSLIDNSNHTECVLTTSGRNKLHFHDQNGKQQIHLHSPTKATWMRLGAAGGGMSQGVGMHSEANRTQNIDQNSKTTVGKGFKRTVDGKVNKQVQGKRKMVFKGENTKTFLGKKTETTLAKKTELKKGGASEVAPKWTAIHLNLHRVHQERTDLAGSSSEVKVSSSQKKDKETEGSGEKVSVALISYNHIGKGLTIMGLSAVATSVTTEIILEEHAICMSKYASVGNSVTIAGISTNIVASDNSEHGETTRTSAAHVSLAGDEDDTAGDDTILGAAMIKLMSEEEIV